MDTNIEPNDKIGSPATTDPLSPNSHKERRWRMVLGTDSEDMSSLSAHDRRLSSALTALYGKGDIKKPSSSLSRSRPHLSKWLGDIRALFPSSVVQVLQKDAFERLGIKLLLAEPKFLTMFKADIYLIADLLSLRSAMSEENLKTARVLVQEVVDKLIQRLEKKTNDSILGALNKSKRTSRPRFNDIDWHRTIYANLRHYQPNLNTIIPEKLVGFLRHQKRITELDEVILCVDQSGSMATSVVYSSIFAAVMASIPAIKTQLICFDTSVNDMTEELSDPVGVLFGVQLGGGTNINQAVAYCENKIERPSKTHFILISDLDEGGNSEELVARIARLIRQDVNVITLLTLSDDGKPYYNTRIAAEFAAIGSPVFACTPDKFPDLMATALKRESISAWAADLDIKTIRES